MTTSQQVLDFRSVYDKLSEDEKRKINEQLLARTSKTFDELLAEAGAQQKPSSSNSDVKNAERKAELRDEIESAQRRRGGSAGQAGRYQ